MNEEFFSETEIFSESEISPEAEIEFQLYSKYALFDLTENKLVLKIFTRRSVFFEVRTQFHKPGQKYISGVFETKDLIKDWKILFSESPNAFINGFDFGGERKLLTLSINNPTIVDDSIYFDFDLDRFESDLDILPGAISEWKDRTYTIKDVTILIDSGLVKNFTTQRFLGHGVESISQLDPSSNLERKMATSYPGIHQALYGRKFVVDSKGNNPDGTPNAKVKGLLDNKVKVAVLK